MTKSNPKFKIGDIISYTGKFGCHFSGYSYLVFKILGMHSSNVYLLELIKFIERPDCFIESINKISSENSNIIDGNFNIDINEKFNYLLSKI